MTTYSHLSPEERAYIMLERNRGASIRDIARGLHRSPSSISRELHRNAPSKRYCAKKAGQAYARRRRNCGRSRKLVSNEALRQRVEGWLIYHKWSPEQIAATLKADFPEQPHMQVSPETIYAHIYLYPRGEFRKLLTQSLRQNKSKRGPRGSKDSSYSSLKITPEQLFANRPSDVNSREIAGHWEGDLIIGAFNQSCVGTLIERKTGFVILAKMKSKAASDVRKGFEKQMKGVPDFLRLSMTYDRGAEMSEHPLMSKNLNIDIYFADCKAPWQRGSSENINGLLRQFLPKGEDLSTYSQEDLDYIAWLLNNRPRKRHGFRSPQTLVEQELDGGPIRVALDS